MGEVLRFSWRPARSFLDSDLEDPDKVRIRAAVPPVVVRPPTLTASASTSSSEVVAVTSSPPSPPPLAQHVAQTKKVIKQLVKALSQPPVGDKGDAVAVPLKKRGGTPPLSAGKGKEKIPAGEVPLIRKKKRTTDAAASPEQRSPKDVPRPSPIRPLRLTSNPIQAPDFTLTSLSTSSASDPARASPPPYQAFEVLSTVAEVRDEPPFEVLSAPIPPSGVTSEKATGGAVLSDATHTQVTVSGVVPSTGLLEGGGTSMAGESAAPSGSFTREIFYDLEEVVPAPSR